MVKKTKKKTKNKIAKKKTQKKTDNLPYGLDKKLPKFRKQYRDMISSKHLPKGHKSNKTVFISGHMDLSKKEFEKYYVKKIDEYCNNGYGFIIGGATGADEMSLNYVINKKAKSIIVCLPEDELEELKKRLGNNVNKVHIISHFSNIKEGEDKILRKFQIRDIFMTNNSSVDISYLRQYAGAGSASAENLYRRKYGIRKAEEIVKIIRNNSMEYDKKIANLTIE